MLQRTKLPTGGIAKQIKRVDIDAMGFTGVSIIIDQTDVLDVYSSKSSALKLGSLEG